ncbi:hypothetical protein BDN70DRAFT_996521 [Pholiota conissans]|uniref:FHA domain-containing protein n=1 Tax=Pholiota conissans TaxID=109636 RepID=A0A9P5YT29_9AGAR|nr:hypothetical protein BDN70DRAFT_996521 [Pholiota conissans]
MPIVPPFPASPGPSAHNALFPALYLYPLNDTWTPKHIALTSAHTKIGRQTSSKTAPGERNGYFDSKVLSRQHAEVWEEGGKIFIKDVKSSNGTFINGERLSSESHESEPFELKSDDIVEFGIDIVGEDNKTIIHHKVAARVVCVFNEQDAAVAARAEQHQAAAQAQQLQQHLQQQRDLHSPGGGAGAQFNASAYHHPGQSPVNGLGIGGSSAPGSSPSSLTGGPGSSASNFPFSSATANGPRRTQLGHSGLGSMGGPPSLARAPGKSGTGLSFDVILSRLQGEVQKSRETGAELGGLQGLMGEVEGVLGGRGPGSLPAFPSHLPSVRPPSENQPPAPQPPPNGPVPAAPIAGSTTTSPPPPGDASVTAGTATSSSPTPATTSVPTINGVSHPPAEASTSTSGAAPLNASLVAELQAQLADTQNSLAVHLERVRKLEDVLKEQEVIKREVGVLREIVEGRRGANDHEEQQESDSKKRKDGLDGLRYDPDELELLERPLDALDDLREEEEEEMDDEDDRRSVSTVMPHELERVDEEDEEEAEEEDRRAREEAALRESESEPREGEHETEEEGVEHEDHFRSSEQSAFEHDDRDGSRREDDDHSYEDDEEREEREREETQQEIEEQERRRQEDLNVGRPRTPEPSLLGLGLAMGRRNGGSPLSTTSNSAANGGPLAKDNSATEDVHVKVDRLTAQVSAVLALTTTLEKQHANAQGTIRELEEKVRSLEGLLAKNAPASISSTSTSTSEPQSETELMHVNPDADASTISDATLVDVESSESGDAKDAVTLPANTTPSALAAWTRSISGQWSTLQADWARERTSLARAKEDWDARALRIDGGLTKLDAGISKLDAGLSKIDAGLTRVDSGLGKVDGVQSAVANLLAAQERVREAVREQGGRLDAHLTAYQAHVQSTASGLANGHGVERWPNGDALIQKRGGLVTPPSPRSQSSDSARYRRRRRRSSGSRRGSRSDDEGDADEEEEDGKHGIAKALGLVAGTAAAAMGAGALATPESSIYGSSTSGPSDAVKIEDNRLVMDTGKTSALLTAPATRANSHAQSEGATDDAASLPIIGLSVWTFLLILSFSVSLLAIVFAYLVAWCACLRSYLFSVFARLRPYASASSLGSLSLSSPLSMFFLSNFDWRSWIQALRGDIVDSPVAEDDNGKTRVRTAKQLNVQTAFGVVVLSIAAAAVIWKIRPVE